MKLRITQTTTTVEVELQPPSRRVDRAEKGPGIASCPAPAWDAEADGETVAERTGDANG